MPAGLQIYNTHGTVSVDDTNPVLHFKAKYTVTVPAGTTPSAKYTFINVPNCTDTSVFAFRPRVANRWCHASVIAGPTSTQRAVWIVNYPAGYNQPLPTDSFQVDIFHYDKPAAVGGGGGMGLQVFNAAGQCMFNSNERPCVLPAAFMPPPASSANWLVNFPNNLPQASTHTMPSGRIGGAIIWGNAKRSVVKRVGSTAHVFDFLTLVAANGRDVSIWPEALYNYYTATSSAPEVDYRIGTGGGFVVDVSGL